MARHEERIKAFVKLGRFLREFLELADYSETALVGKNPWLGKLVGKIADAGQQNPWFTEDSIRYALGAWAKALTEENIEQWLASYEISPASPRTIAIIMAGNIPLVGFHDFLCVLVTGNRALIKVSSNDRILLPFFAEFLNQAEPEINDSVCFAEGPIKGYDAVIATGSDNTARYFQYYFGNKPHIIRKNKNSVAVLTGNESKEDLHALGSDIFTYFGLGCRNVSKIFVPEAYDFNTLFGGLEGYAEIVNHRKYRNNYDYNKAVFLMSKFQFLDNGFVLLKEDMAFASPIGSLFYEHYSNRQKLEERLLREGEKIQCVVGNPHNGREIPFGSSQRPSLYDYADAVDTVDFLLKT